MADAHHFPMAGFRLTLLDLVRSVLSRIYYNDYILVWPHNGHMSVQHRAQQHSSDQGSAAVAEFSELRVSSDGPGEGPAGKAPAQEVEEAEEAEEASLWETAAEESEESSLWEVAQEPAAPEREPSGGEGFGRLERWRKKNPDFQGFHFAEAHGNVINADSIPKFISLKVTSNNMTSTIYRYV
ncbi:hypothetical protein MG293_005253 [Ovis ammon polii]|uniref:Uncharacterized protein n=1 Tax=Ovis ammon polii TaxID=230172 RepID=A0AAD4UI07_OVIAM|nr:hypothetical protein MG293_005253 [Ovis ammon polii]